MSLEAIDDADKTFQFRLNEQASSLVESLRRNGQLNPVKLIHGHETFRVLDGFRRTAAARKLGWRTIRAVVYPPMREEDAKKIAFVSNVVRRNLTVVEKANAIQMALQEGYSKAEVAEMFSISTRQIERYLALPDDILARIDGREITMAHARILRDCQLKMKPAQFEQLVARVRAEKMSAPRLAQWLVEAEQGVPGATIPRSLGLISSERVKVHAIELSRASSAKSREETMAFLRRALRRIEEFGVPRPRDGNWLESQG